MEKLIFDIDIFEKLAMATIDEVKQLIPEIYRDKLNDQLSHWVEYVHGRNLFVRDFSLYFGPVPQDICEKIIWYSKAHVFSGYYARFYKSNLRAAKMLFKIIDRDDFEKQITNDVKGKCNQYGLCETNAIYGTLDSFWETGTEGIIWSIYDDQAIGYSSLFGVDQGDFLEVYNDHEEILWSGVIDYDLKKNVVDSHGSQVIEGMYVHGIQKKVGGKTWKRMFDDGRRAKLIKKVDKKSKRIRNIEIW